MVITAANKPITKFSNVPRRVCSSVCTVHQTTQISAANTPATLHSTYSQKLHGTRVFRDEPQESTMKVNLQPAFIPRAGEKRRVSKRT